MKSVLLIGMGRFGHHLCRYLLDQKNEVMAVDKSETALEDVAPLVTSALVADCTKESVLKSIGISDFDVCFVCIGDDFQSNLEITSMLKDLGARFVVSLSNSVTHTKFLLRNGADDVVHPDKDIAERTAVKYSSDNVFDYIELRGDYSIFEVSPLKQWIGKSLRAADIRARHNISIIAIKSGDEFVINPPADRVINAGDHLMVISHKKDMGRIMNEFK